MQRVRVWIRVAVILYGVSLLFPLVASVRPAGNAPLWVGVLDVGLALLLLLLHALIVPQVRGRVDTAVELRAYRLYRSLAALPLLLLLLFFLVGDRILWGVLLPGLAWRSWLLLYSLPFVLAGWESAAAGRAS